MGTERRGSGAQGIHQAPVVAFINCDTVNGPLQSPEQDQGKEEEDSLPQEWTPVLVTLPGQQLHQLKAS